VPKIIIMWCGSAKHEMLCALLEVCHDTEIKDGTKPCKGPG
jgi:hypothetical protein